MFYKLAQVFPGPRANCCKSPSGLMPVPISTVKSQSNQGSLMATTFTGSPASVSWFSLRLLLVRLHQIRKERWKLPSGAGECCMLTRAMNLVSRFGITAVIVLACSVVTPGQWTKANNGSKNVSNCVLLTDGTVICQEGETTSTLVRLTPDKFGSYSSGTWSDTNISPLPSGYAPRFFCSAVLADGRVIFIGGEYNDSSTGDTNLGAILDPTGSGGMGTWAPLNPPDSGASPWNKIGDAPCLVLPNKKLILGSIFNADMAQLDPSTLNWTDLNPTTTKLDSNSEEGWTLLPDGTVLTVDTGVPPNTGNFNITAGVSNTGEIYTPSTNTWSTTATTGGVILDGNVPNCCVPETGPQILRPDGTVIAIGATPNTASYNYLTGVWTAGPTFPTTVASYPTSTNCPATMATNYPSAGEPDGPASILPDGNVLVAGSPVDSSGNEYHCASFFEFDGTNLNPVAGTSNAPNVPTFGMRMLVLPTGEVLVTDGSSDAELYNDGGTYQAAWQPTITSAPANLGQGETYNISGTQFNGLSGGAAYGDDSEFATNYPLVRIVNNGTGHVRYCRTHDHSTMGVATGSAIVSTNVDVPADLELGPSQLFVVANGIPSAALSINVGLGSSLAFTGGSATSADFNDAVTVQAQLTSGGSPVSTPETVTFVLGSGAGTETCSGTTNPSGVASCLITPNQAAGSYTLTAAFAGDSTYGASSTSTAFTILLEDTAVTFTAASATTSDYDDAATVQATLTDPTDGTPIQGKTVTFVLGSGGGTETCSGPTNPSGLAFCSITPNQAAGVYTLTASFTGDAFDQASSASTLFTITKEETSTAFASGSPTVIASGHSTTFSATLLEDGVTPIVGRNITITLGAQSCLTNLTSAAGTGSCAITPSGSLGPGTVTASFAGDAFYLPSSVSEPVIVFAFLNSGSMIIGNLDGASVEFWGAQWSTLNSLSGGPAPSAFKGFASTAPQVCAGSWSSNPGTSPPPPAGPLPSYMGVIVSSTVVQSGTSISGDVPKIVVVVTNAGYAPNAGHPGTGTVVATYCGH